MTRLLLSPVSRFTAVLQGVPSPFTRIDERAPRAAVCVVVAFFFLWQWLLPPKSACITGCGTWSSVVVRDAAALRGSAACRVAVRGDGEDERQHERGALCVREPRSSRVLLRLPRGGGDVETEGAVGPNKPELPILGGNVSMCL